MAKTRRIEFDTIGLPEQWAEILDPMFMSYKKLRALRTELSEMIEKDGSVGVTESDVVERMLCTIIVDWKVINVDEDGFLTGKPTIETVVNAPMGALMKIVGTLREVTEELVPKGSGSTSQ